MGNSHGFLCVEFGILQILEGVAQTPQGSLRAQGDQGLEEKK